MTPVRAGQVWASRAAGRRVTVERVDATHVWVRGGHRWRRDTLTERYRLVRDTPIVTVPTTGGVL